MERDKHPSREVLSRFISAQCSREEAQTVVSHLLSGCDSCPTVIQSCVASLNQKGDGVTYIYPQFEKAEFYIRFVQSIIEREKSRKMEERNAVDQWLRLSRMDAEQRSEALRDPKFHTWGLAAYLIAKGEELSRDTPEVGLNVLSVASSICDRLDATYYSLEIKTELRAQCLIAKANAFRLNGRFKASGMHIDLALDYLDGLTTDNNELLARAESVYASLKNDLGEFEQAVALLESARKYYEREENWHQVGRTLIKQSATMRNFLPEKGFAVAIEGLRIIDDTDQYTAACGWFGIVDNLNESGNPRQALQEYRRYRDRLKKVPSSRFQLQLKWLGARLDASLWEECKITDFLEMSAQAYIELFEAFSRRQWLQELAISQVEYVMLLEKAGALPAALPHLLDAIQIFRAQELRTDLLASLCYLQSLVESSAATAANLSNLRTIFTRYWKVPIPEGKRVI